MAPTLRVPLLDLKPQYAPLREDIEAAIRAVSDSQYFILGPRVSELEEAIASYCSATHGVGVSSGTDALLLALMALDIGPGDEVITSPFTFFATAGVIARLGARPVFCDIEFPSFNLSPAQVARFLEDDCQVVGSKVVNRKTGAVVRAVLPVHLYGQMADMDVIMSLATRYGLAVVEDAAQAIGAALPDGRSAGSVGDIGCFSFFPTKNLGAFGDAGMCVTGSGELEAKLRILRVHGGEPKYYHSLIGGNFRLDELQAAVLLVKLAKLDEWTSKRRRNAARYDALFAAAGLSEHVTPPQVEAGFGHVFNQYVIRAADRDGLRAHLANCGIGTEIYYPLSLHEQACFAYLEHEAADFPNANTAARESLALPIYAELSDEQLEYVVDCIATYYGRAADGPEDL